MIVKWVIGTVKVALELNVEKAPSRRLKAGLKPSLYD
jgi:hypothetical protein